MTVVLPLKLFLAYTSKIEKFMNQRVFQIVWNLECRYFCVCTTITGVTTGYNVISLHLLFYCEVNIRDYQDYNHYTPRYFF